MRGGEFFFVGEEGLELLLNLLFFILQLPLNSLQFLQQSIPVLRSPLGLPLQPALLVSRICLLQLKLTDPLLF